MRRLVPQNRKVTAKMTANQGTFADCPIISPWVGLGCYGVATFLGGSGSPRSRNTGTRAKLSSQKLVPRKIHLIVKHLFFRLRMIELREPDD